MVNSETFLKIKCFGRAKLTSIDYRMNNMKTTFKYKWSAENDTLIIWPKKGREVEKYKMILGDGSILYLESTTENGKGYSRCIKG
jgi:hypothetical protein